MTEPQHPPTPGERRLARPPSDRYGAATSSPAPSAAPPAAGGSLARGLAWAVVAGIGGAGAITVLGGVLGMTAGLLLVAAAGGWVVGFSLTAGGGAAISPSARPWIAIAVALATVALGSLGLWLYARTEGGVLPLVDYLTETFGPLVPLEAALAAATAWWSAR